jgi:hypothetical protein
MLTIVFGSPGAGKTTLAARYTKQFLKQNIPVYGNAEIVGMIPFPLEKLGKVTPPAGSVLIVDEAGIEYNNRKYKTLPQKTIEWFKLHRHYGVDIIVLSQSWEDMDITLRRLADKLVYIRKLGAGLTILRPVKKFVQIDQETHQIVDGFRFLPIWYSLLRTLIIGRLVRLPKPFSFLFRPRYYKLFDSWAVPETPVFENP